VAYHVELNPATVVPYLLRLDLSAAGKEALGRIFQGLAEHGDRFIGDPTLRLRPDSDCFKVEWVFRDPDTRVFHALHLIVSDASAAFGVLRVEYAEVFSSAFPWPDS
jgi:hypothetical protein